MVEDVAPVRRVVDDETDDGEIGFVASRVTGRLRLVAGMVRANRPGRALLGLSKLLVGAFGTAAFALATNSIWQMGDALDGLRLTVIMLLPRRPGRVADLRARPVGEAVAGHPGRAGPPVQPGHGDHARPRGRGVLRGAVRRDRSAPRRC